MKKTSTKFDIYETITNKVIEQLEKGTIPWRKPWNGTREGAISHATGKPYSLLNQFLLQRPGEYITFKQALDEGGHVKKGAKSHMIVYWNFYVKKETNDAGEEVERKIPILKYYNVFHIDDCEGIKAKYEFRPTENDPIETAEKIIDNYALAEDIEIKNKDITNDAYYSPKRDYIKVPCIKQFENVAEYYSTLFHEMTHSTGHVSRLNRFDGNAANAAFGSEDYSKEELVAEIGAAALCNYAGIDNNAATKNSVAYIQSWLSVLKNDKHFIVSAASKAEKAVDYILAADERIIPCF